MKYKKIKNISRKKAENIFKNKSSNEISSVLFGIVNNGDLDWLIETYKKFLYHENQLIVSAAITNLGYLPRYYEINNVDELICLLNDKKLVTPELVDQIEDAIDDIKIFSC